MKPAATIETAVDGIHASAAALHGQVLLVLEPVVSTPEGAFVACVVRRAELRRTRPFLVGQPVGYAGRDDDAERGGWTLYPAERRVRDLVEECAVKRAEVVRAIDSLYGSRMHGLVGLSAWIDAARGYMTPRGWTSLEWLAHIERCFVEMHVTATGLAS